MGNAAAVESSFVSEVTIESCVWVVSIMWLITGSTDRPAAQHITNRRRHVYVLADDKVRAQRRDLVVGTLSLPPILLADHPHPAILMLKPIVRGVVRDHEFQPAHALQMALERSSGLDDVVKVGVVQRLVGEGGIVGGWIEEGRSCEIVQD